MEYFTMISLLSVCLVYIGFICLLWGVFYSVTELIYKNNDTLICPKAYLWNHFTLKINPFYLGYITINNIYNLIYLSFLKRKNCKLYFELIWYCNQEVINNKKIANC